MARRFPLLSPRQLEVLTWVGEGCPEHVWPDATYKHTVYGLAERGLVTVDRRRKTWSVVVTDDGRFYLDHGTYPDRADRERAGRAFMPPAPKPHGTATAPVREFPVSPTDLVAQLQASGTPLTVPDPPPPLRVGYRRAINHARRYGLVPDGYALRHTGRTTGDLVISLVAADETGPQPVMLDPVPVPDILHDLHPVVHDLQHRQPELLHVSDASRDRALRILQAIALECQRRGHPFGLRPDQTPTFQIQIGPDTFAFTLAEEYEKRDVIDPVSLEQARYPWQRLPAHLGDVPSGRLVLRLDEGPGSVAWADRKRWTLEAKLAALFDHITHEAAAAVTARADRERQQAERRRAWQAAVEQAKRDYVLDLNRARLHQQASHFTHAEELRRYTTRLNELLTTTHLRADERDRLRTWTQWATQEADRVDPLLNPDQLHYTEPTTITPHQYEPFMPHGMNAWTPHEQ